MQLGILASGGLGQTILTELIGAHQVKFVFTDKGSTGIINICNEENVPVFTGNPRNGKAAEFITACSCDVLLSINYLFIVDRDIIGLGKKYAINFHGSLLPKYRGRTPHVWAIINNEKKTGITAHLIDEGCDTGDIVYQEAIEIGPEQTGADLLVVYQKRYPVIVNEVLRLIANDTIKRVQQDESKASYFGKRTPEDGQINWSWQRERIQNWVRAQAQPYPGAFSYVNKQKVVIHKVSLSDEGFSWDQSNGQVLKANTDNILVKTPNGVLEISNFESAIKINTGDIFHE